MTSLTPPNERLKQHKGKRTDGMNDETAKALKTQPPQTEPKNAPKDVSSSCRHTIAKPIVPQTEQELFDICGIVKAPDGRLLVSGSPLGTGTKRLKALKKLLTASNRASRIDELNTLLSNVPMPKLSYEQVENRIAELKRLGE